VNRTLITFLAGALVNTLAIVVIVILPAVAPGLAVLKAGSAQTAILIAIPLAGLRAGLTVAAMSRFHVLNVQVEKAAGLGMSWAAGCVHRCNSVRNKNIRGRRIPQTHALDLVVRGPYQLRRSNYDAEPGWSSST
jgi:hypothetical protein